MRFYRYFYVHLILAAALPIAGCVLSTSESAKRASSSGGLIATPASHYSTSKARALGERYKENLNRLVERVIINPATTNLQFANNISSLGGIGFFTHSAVKAPDERFLEIVLSTAETFENKGEYSSKVARLFSLFGGELLGILYDESEIYRDRDLAGYGLNFTWRTADKESGRARLGSERAVAYFEKDKVAAFLKRKVDANELLASAVIFAVEDEGPMTLVSYRPLRQTPDSRPSIHEQVLLPEVAAWVSEEKQSETPTSPPAVGEGKSMDLGSSGSLDQAEGEGSTAEARVIPDGGDVELGTREVDPVWTSVLPPVEPAVAPAQWDDGNPGDLVAVFGTNPAVERFVATEDEKVSSPAGAELEAEPALAVRAMDERDVGSPADQLLRNRDEGIRELTVLGEQATETIIVTAADTLDRPKIADSDEKPVEKGQSPEEVGGSINDTPPSEPKRVSSSGPSAERNMETASTGANTEPSLEAAPKVIPPAGPGVDVQLPVNPTEERLALAREKPAEKSPAAKSLARPVPRALEGFVIQVPFGDKVEALRWADVFERRGYAVSITESAATASLRLRIGNFRIRDDAEREMQRLKRDGLNGIILNLPQAFQPDFRPSLP